MAESHLGLSDWLIISIYFIFVIGIGFYVRKTSQTGEQFFLAGRSNSAWIAGLAFLSANLGAIELLAMAGQAYKYGMLTAHFYWIGSIPAMLFLGIYMMPFYYRRGIYSVPSYLKVRFNESTRTLNAIGFAVMTLLVSGINLYAMALVLNVFVGWDMNFCIWISSVTVAIYVVLGGLTSAIFSEVLQFFLIWAGLSVVVILGLVDVGGVHGIVERIPEGFTHLWAQTGTAHQNPMLIDWFGIAMGIGFVLSFGYWATDFLVVQRAFSAKDLHSAQMAPVMATFFKMMITFLVVGVGLIGLTLVSMKAIPAPSHPDAILMELMERYYPSGLLGLGVTALLAGFMSGQAGNVSAFNTVFTYDLYKVHIVKNASDAHYVWVGRVVTLLGVLFSIITAYWAMGMPSIMEYMQVLFSIINAPLFATVALGMFWKRATGAGAFWGLLAGMVVSAAMFLLVKAELIDAATFTLSSVTSSMAAAVWRAIWAFLITFCLTVLISLVTRPAPVAVNTEEGSKYAEPDSSTLVWHKRPTFWAMISLVILFILNIVFW